MDVVNVAHVKSLIFGTTDVTAAQYFNIMGVFFAYFVNICEY